ncbi:hypothetical protein HY449_04940 [Candidatus Pacearchaeota archaeon]|nr:hypothetical protein [Candidatus Pacearchaeota archaeon]
MKREKRLKVIVISVILILILFLAAIFFSVKLLKKEAKSERYYVSDDVEFCKQIKFLCKPEYEPFSDDKGCGCRLIQNNSGDTSEKKTFCTEESRGADVCVELYMPVCGWFSSEIKCAKYPCAQTFSNSCFACSNNNVEYYTPGECPK